jgi:Xaa-Pro aminopeptidase
MMDINNKIKRLRDLMKENQIDAYLISGVDPHLSEYTPTEWKTREWISGFTGSHGKVVITMSQALLWTDTRYFLQAIEELSTSGIRLMKERVPNAVSIEDWLCSNLSPGSQVAVDGLTLSASEAIQMESKLTAKGISFNNTLDLVGKIWINRPPVIEKQIYEFPINFAGKSREEKIGLVRKALEAKELDSTIVSMLDDVAWLFNLRGDDIEFTPLFTAYGYIDRENAFLFVDSGRISETLRVTLENEGVIIYSYDAFLNFLDRIRHLRIQFDPNRTNSLIINHIDKSNYTQSSLSIVAQIKSVKDQEEIAHIKSAHIKDGAAMVNFLYWFKHLPESAIVSELSIADELTKFRSEQPYFKGNSFHPIVGFGAHGAIVHYHATSQSNIEIGSDGLLLIDSGGHYLDGTTDITRTISTGNIKRNQRVDFTICLKGHIALAMAIFPSGTKGHSLDSIARKPLWDNALNYGHGTGHGIGYFLSVHEGPMSIRAEFNNESICEGHLLSNEPGIYREGEYGIRIENVILCKKYKSNQFADFLCFETLSLCPFEKELILPELLSRDEIDWVNHYHETVFKEISPVISDQKTIAWLKSQCSPLIEQK